MKEHLPEEELEKLKKANRLKRRTPKRHKITHESGRGTKNILRIIMERAKGKR